MFRSPHAVVDRRGRTRSALTVIYFLLADEDVSAWHRLGCDETWHFARGEELEIAVLDETGRTTIQRLGPAGPSVAVIPADRPFAARLAGGAGYALVSCCVAPGFEFEDFELLDARALALAHPASTEAISSFAR